MKKQLFFLFAAAALFAGCSSDELVNDGGQQNEGGDVTVVEETVPYVSVAADNGLSMSVGSLEDVAATRAATGQLYFDLEIKLEKLLEWKDYLIETDDFNIRIDGEYMELTTDDSKPNSVGYATVKLESDHAGSLWVRASGLENSSIFGDDGSNEVTFEVYMWIKNREMQDDGSGSYDELFEWDDKMNWIGEDTKNMGYDMSIDIYNENGAVLHDSGLQGQGKSEKGYGVRFNVFRGLSGRPVDANGNFDKENGLGDTPYIKVSIHVNKLDDNEFTYVVPVDYTNPALDK